MDPFAPTVLSPDATAADIAADITQESIHPATTFGADTFPKVDVPHLTPDSLLPTGTGVERADCASARSASTSASPSSDLRPQSPGTFSIPEFDTIEFTQLPQQVRDDVRRLLHAFRCIHTATNKITACKVQAGGFQGRRGFSWNSIYRKYYDYVSSWDWRTVMDKAKAGPRYWSTDQPSSLPFAFLEFWRGKAGANQRKCRPAWRGIIRQWEQWRAGDRRAAIPGYDSCPPADPATGRPRGWEYSNLMRHRPTRFELLAQRQGRSAAADARPLVFTTRVGLAVGQYYLFDDFWHDFKVVKLGQRRAQRLLQFHALDLFSGCNFARGYKPIIEDEMTGAMERLKEAEMIFLLAHVLATFGYREQGTVLVVEHGTAAIRSDIEAKLADLTAGAVRVERSGMEGVAAFAGAYAGRSKGNYRFKAALESIGNLIHNETADTLLIPGQTGSNSRLNAPEELHGRDRHTDLLLRAIAAMPPERAALLRMPFLEFTQAVWVCNEIHDRINARIDHALEGWQAAGLVTSEWRMASDQPWLPISRLLSMPAEQRTALEHYVSTQSDLTRARKLSPTEVFGAGRRALVKLPSHKVATLLYECGSQSGRTILERPVKSRLIEFEDADLAPDKLRYLAEARIPGRPPEPLPEDEKYAIVVNPLNLDEIHLFDARGGYVGACQRWASISRADTDAIHRQCGQAARIERELLEPVARRGAATTRQRIQDARHNAAVLGGKPVTQAEKERARSLRHFDGSPEEFLSAAPSDPSDGSAPSDPSDNDFSAEALL